MEREDASIQLVADRLNSLHSDLNDLKDSMRESMREMTAAVTRLAQIDERQIHMNRSHEKLETALQKSNEKLEKLENRIDTLEKEAPMNKQAVKWIYSAVWAVVAAAAAAFGKYFGIY